MPAVTVYSSRVRSPELVRTVFFLIPPHGTYAGGMNSSFAPWIVAAYQGACSDCGWDIEPGEEIRADGAGGWQRRECCSEGE